jgi:hypothetical protein
MYVPLSGWRLALVLGRTAQLWRRERIIPTSVSRMACSNRLETKIAPLAGSTFGVIVSEAMGTDRTHTWGGSGCSRGIN